MNLRLFITLNFCLIAFVSVSFGQSSSYKVKKADLKVLGDGGPAIKARINGPDSLAFDNNGNLLIVELRERRIRRIDVRTGIIITTAGNGRDEYAGDGGPATEASLDYPLAVIVDNSGNYFIAEITGRIRRVDAETKVITTIAGNGKLGDGGTGDGGPAVSASFRRPYDMALDNEGNLFIADDMDHRIRRIDAKTGIISTVAGGGDKNPGDGEIATNASLIFPQGIALDSEGNMFIADYQHHRIRMVNARTHIITTIAGTGEDNTKINFGAALKVNMKYPSAIAIDNEGNLFTNGGRGVFLLRIDTRTNLVSAYAGKGVEGFSGNGGLATKAKISTPSGIAVDKKGNVYFSEYSANYVRRVDAKTGIITIVGGNGLPK